jgi:formyl-CoA transferase
MKALFYREKSGQGSCINLSMFESSVSWLTVPITMTASFQKKSTRRGNTHEFFCPVSVYQSQNGYIYLAVGNDRQWKTMVSQDIFRSLDIPAYEKNAGRINDVARLEAAINAITRKHTSEELIAMFQKMTVPVSKIQTLPEVIQDPLVKKRLLSAQDPKTGTQITLAPAPRMTPFLEENNRQLEFPPRFGEDNFNILGEELGYSKEVLSTFKEKGII